MNSVAESVITPEIINEAMDYDEYRQMIDELLEQDKTTGDNHSEEMVHYTKMNVQRMNRLDKRVELMDSLVEELNELDENWIWLVLTEAWCGDAAQNIPALVKIANESENIDIKFILRDEHLNIMDEYLTNGGRSIPKLICLDADTFKEIGTWGPRPDAAQEKAMAWKNDEGISKEEWAKKLHKWYAKDRTHEFQSEFKKIMEEWRE
ncbi:thioredoxin family protein [Fodinibius sp.]|uniref:thioredoxin family protein n=1 Tax=Fodinibius sp. TaxID=1872440 RepID=UPI002ACEF4A1|nr:thioredoxin family protein [Fodinibius sp.]MDZ7657840.1 thioredoxin family protein [Fodinibius sp.]